MMDKLIQPIPDNAYPRYCDIKGCDNISVSFVRIKGLMQDIVLCPTCKKKLYEELKEGQ